MTTAALEILESPDRLAETEKRSVAIEILRRSASSDRRSPAVVGVGAFHSGRSDVSARAEDLMREAASRRR